MPPATTFPRPGIELSASASLRFPTDAYEQQAILSDFGNGWKERRAVGGGRFTDMSVECKVNATDMQTIMTFLQARSLSVESFTLVHPYLGSATANFVGTKLPRAVMIESFSAPWFSFSLTFEGSY